MKQFLRILFFLLPVAAAGQKFNVEKSMITFFSDAAIEDISAKNEKTNSIFNSETGEIAFSIPIKEFKFEKSLMQEHFNEKYMDSEKYPKSTFQGKLTGFDAKKTGSQDCRAQGKLFIHGITKDIDVPGTLEMTGGKVLMKSKFIVKLQDYEIAIPKLLWQNIAEQVEVSIDFIFKPYEK